MKNKIVGRKNEILRVMSVAVLISALCHAEDVISINFMSSAEGFQKVNPGKFSGIKKDASWENILVTPGSQIFSDLDGSTLGVSVKASSLTAAPDIWSGYPNRAGLRAVTGKDVEVVLTGIPYEKYYMIAYVGGWGKGKGSVSSGGSVRVYDFASLAQKASEVESKDSNAEDGCDVGSYVVFGSKSEPLTDPSVALTLKNLFGTVFLGGFQIVAADDAK